MELINQLGKKWSDYTDELRQKMNARIKLSLFDRGVVEATTWVIGALFVGIRVISLIGPETKTDFGKAYLFNVKTPTHRVKVFLDFRAGGHLMLFRQRGFLKQWENADKDEIPSFLAEEIFSVDCPKERREKLVDKVLKLRAFW